MDAWTWRSDSPLGSSTEKCRRMSSGDFKKAASIVKILAHKADTFLGIMARQVERRSLQGKLEEAQEFG